METVGRFETMRIGVVVERRRRGGRWPGVTWRAIAVVPGGGPGGWRRLDGDDELCRFHAGCLELELHHRQSVEYRYNLRSSRPSVFVALRPEPADGVRPWRATVSAHEAEATLDGGDDLVSAVPLPPAVAAWMERFVAAHPVVEPFRKRRPRRAAAGDGEPGVPAGRR